MACRVILKIIEQEGGSLCDVDHDVWDLQISISATYLDVRERDSGQVTGNVFR